MTTTDEQAIRQRAAQPLHTGSMLLYGRSDIAFLLAELDAVRARSAWALRAEIAQMRRDGVFPHPPASLTQTIATGNINPGLTYDEIQSELDDHDEAVRTYFERLNAGRCVECDAPVERQQQIGPGVYAEPCGHRQYQGKVAAR